jgi:hypothetical protein
MIRTSVGGELVRVKLHQQVEGQPVGAVVDVDDERGQFLTSNGYASAVSEKTPTPTNPGDVDPPARSATKAEWATYATTRGATQDGAEAMTKAELIERYG